MEREDGKIIIDVEAGGIRVWGFRGYEFYERRRGKNRYAQVTDYLNLWLPCSS
jgi:hypothetical protein